MIKTGVKFTTTNKKLSDIYESAMSTLLQSIKPFGGRNVLLDSPESDKISLDCALMSALTLAQFDMETAVNSVMVFLLTQREDGRLASSVACVDGRIEPSYNALTGLGYANEVWRIYALMRKKNPVYAQKLCDSLIKLDEYLWAKHDKNANGCLEIFSESDSFEGEGAMRFAPIRVNVDKDTRTISPFPVETPDLMAFDYSVRRTISEFGKALGRKDAQEWAEKAERVKAALIKHFWDTEDGTFRDRDYAGRKTDVMVPSDVVAMYYGACSDECVFEFMNRHFKNSNGFMTPMPLPSIAVGDRRFTNNYKPNHNGQPRAQSYFRALYALADYGYCSTLAHLGKKFLSSVGENCYYTEQYDTFTGKPVRPAIGHGFVPAAATALEFIARFYGVRQVGRRLIWGALGFESEEDSSEYIFESGTDSFKLSCEGNISAGYINGSPLFTVSKSVLVTTDMYGNNPVVSSMSSEPIDCVIVYRSRVFSFVLNPDETKAL